MVYIQCLARREFVLVVLLASLRSHLSNGQQFGIYGTFIKKASKCLFAIISYFYWVNYRLTDLVNTPIDDETNYDIHTGMFIYMDTYILSVQDVSFSFSNKNNQNRDNNA